MTLPSENRPDAGSSEKLYTEIRDELVGPIIICKFAREAHLRKR